ncbi:MAG: hypothetical protein AB7T38_15300 [Nitrospirales bacterium]
MFSQKWGKAPPLLSGCPKSCDPTFELSPAQSAKLSCFNLPVLLGMTLLLCGCSFEQALPGKNHWHPDLLKPMPRGVQPSIIYISMDSSPTKSIPENAATPAEPLLNKNKGSAGSDQPQPQIPAIQEQKPAILVPEIPNKDNGQMIVTYKSKMEETQNLIRTINESQLTKEQHDTYISINSFLEKSREAFSQDDLPMAMNLAEKAHTLVKEIVNNSVKQ